MTGRPIEDLPGFVHQLVFGVRDVLVETAERVKARMSESGAPVTYPVQWDSPIQRKAYFASEGFGKGIPYERTNHYPLSWLVDVKPYGAILHAPHPAGAVGGLPSGWQSRIHRGRWPHLLTVLFEELARVPAEISNKFRVVSGK